MKVYAIAAMDESRVIGSDNQLPWHISDDMKRTSKLTTGNSVLMGRKTFLSLPEKYRPLPNRLNVVCTRNPESLSEYSDIMVVGDPVEFIESRGEHDLQGEILWVFGGEDIYRKTLPLCEQIYLTRVYGEHEGDAHFPEFESGFELSSEDRYDTHSFEIHTRKS